MLPPLLFRRRRLRWVVAGEYCHQFIRLSEICSLMSPGRRSYRLEPHASSRFLVGSKLPYNETFLSFACSERLANKSSSTSLVAQSCPVAQNTDLVAPVDLLLHKWQATTTTFPMFRTFQPFSQSFKCCIQVPFLKKMLLEKPWGFECRAFACKGSDWSHQGKGGVEVENPWRWLKMDVNTSH